MNLSRKLQTILSICLVVLKTAGFAAAGLVHTITSSTDVAVTGSSYAADGTLDLTLGFAPIPGMNLTVVQNTGPAFITGTFANAPQGATVPLTYNGVTYQYIANYFGGNGRSLVLQWPCMGMAGWGWNHYGQVGNNSSNGNSAITPVAVTINGTLTGKTVVSVAAGGAHSLALTSDGRIYAWGGNLSGQLGNNSRNTSGVPVEVDMSGALLGKTVVAVAAGGDHSLALTSDGRVFAWGSNNNGQLGNDSTTNSLVPVPVNTDGVLAGKTVVALTAGVWHNLALTSDGMVVAWGYNSSSQLGTNDMPNSKVPVLTAPAALAGKTIVALAAGFYHSMALTSDGKILAWGSNSDGQLGKSGIFSGPTPVEVSTSGALLGKQVASISAGTNHSMAVTADGQVFAWGNNWYGQLGNNSTTNSPEPVAVSTGGDLSGKVVIAAAGASQHSLALTSDGRISAWGYNGSGELGNNSSMSGPFLVPGAVDTSGILSGRLVTEVAASVQHNLALFGLGSPTVARHPANQMAASGTSVTFSAAATDPFAFSVRWQVSETGVAGPFSDITGNATSTANDLVLANITPAQNGYAYRAVFTNAAGFAETTAASLTVVTWSAAFSSATDVPFQSDEVTVSGNLDLQLGFAPAVGTHLTVLKNNGPGFINGTFDNIQQGARVTLAYNGLSYDFIANYHGGNGRSLVLQWPWMKLAAWGANGSGQLGNGSTTTSTTPVAVDASGLMAGKLIFSAAAGSGFNLAVSSEGETLSWGYNAFGQLGNNSTVRSPAAVAVDTSGILAGKSVIAVAGGDNHSLALTTDGKVYSWGSNYEGVLGHGGSNSSVPVAVDTSGVLAGRTVTAIAAGDAHSLALDAEGRLFSWGDNDYGQLGNDGSLSSPVPVSVVSSGMLLGKTIVAIAAGEDHSMALSADGQVFAWGANSYGQLGTGGTTNSRVPVKVDASGTLAGKTVIAIAAGEFFSMALTSEGRVVTWGRNLYGQLGDNSTTDSSSPVAVITTGALADKTVVSIAAGFGHCLARTADGQVVGWGLNGDGQLGNDTNTNSPVPVPASGLLSDKKVTAITAGAFHNLAMYGVAGSPSVTANPVNLTVIQGNSPANLPISFSAAAVDIFPFSIQWQVSPAGIAGPFSDITGNPSAFTGTLVLPAVPPAEYGHAYRAVFSNNGGTSTTTAATVTVLTASSPLIFTTGSEIPMSAGNPMVSGSLDITLGFAPNPGTDLTIIKNPGTAFISGEFGNLPQGATIPLTYGGVTHHYVVNYFAGNGRSLMLQWALTKAVSWGAGSTGQLGNNSTAASKLPVLVNASGVLAGKNLSATAAGSNHGLAITPTGEVFAWGANAAGQLGDNSTTNRTVPVAVDATGDLTGKSVVAVAAGDLHSLALTSDGEVFAWGSNGSGRLGNAGTTNSSVPVAVSTSGALSGRTISAIAAGGAHSLALGSDGRMFAWGSNSAGQLGNRSTTTSSSPVEVFSGGVLAGKTVITIAAGNSHNLALTSDGRVYGWGLNQYGQLGVPSPTTSSAPVAVNGTGLIAGKTVIAIVAGANHSLALTFDGFVYAWGLGTSGQLGNGSTSTTPFPQAVATNGVLSGKSVVSIAAGVSHSLAVTSEGKAYAWGSNSSGQIGDNSFNSILPSPVAVATSSGAIATRKVLGVSGGNAHSLALIAAGVSPSVTAHPANRTIPATGNVTFSAIGDGYPAPTVRWQQSSTGPAGTFSNITSNTSATTPTLELTAVLANSNGYAYRAVFTNSEASVNSTPATLTVIPPPALTLPANIVVDATDKNGTEVTFTVSANDNQDGSLTPACNPPSGSKFPIGTTTVNCSVTNSLGSTSTASFTVTVKRSYASFADFHQLTDADPSADPNHTGLDNLTAYAFGMNPAAPDRRQLPVASIVGGYLQISYPRWKDAADLSYTVELSDDLQIWNSGVEHSLLLSVNSIDATRERVVERDLTPVSGSNFRYIRVRMVK